ncbi:MAG: c-type cytochrome biogenesis protein CcmI [Candidatus Pelagadaptatus aseana]|uniref:c-type cytochrome biogenesis protein CcmI n=1 Tax=Candidatus Pelagadaptatus aseana TaxID=3120508 RepID=UPI0039B1B316
MSQFWPIAAVLMCVAAFFVVWPALGRGRGSGSEEQGGFLLDLFNENRAELQSQLDSGEISQAEFDQLNAELQQGLLQDADNQQVSVSSGSRWPLLVFAALVMLGSAIFYLQRGSMADVAIQGMLEQRYAQSMNAFQGGDPMDPTLTEELIQALADRVEGSGDQSENRYLLARLAAESGRYGVAVEQYTVLLQTTQQNDPRLIAELAQVVFLASGNQVTPEVSMLIAKALELNGNETTALGLAGVEAYEKGRFQQAIEFWQKAIAGMPHNSPVIAGMEAGIERARARLADDDSVAQGQSAADVAADTVESDASDLSRVTVTVDLAEGVDIDQGAVALVYAREWGGRMPLAISRFPASELPRRVTLDETMSMMPGINIATVEKLELVARISKSGGAMPQSGDWQVSVGPIVLSEVSEPVSMIVEKQLP